MLKRDKRNLETELLEEIVETTPKDDKIITSEATETSKTEERPDLKRVDAEESKTKIGGKVAEKADEIGNDKKDDAKTIRELMEEGELNFEENTTTREMDILRQFTPTVELPIDERPIVSIKSLTKSIFSFSFKRLIKRKRSELYVDILRKIDLRIFKNERIAIVGRNGSGKTTLAEIISGFKKPTTGFLEYNFNYDISPYEKISLLFQNHNYLDNFTIQEIKEYMVNFAGGQTDDKGVKKLNEILQIDSFMEKSFKDLSGGQKQKVSLFLTLIYKPKLLILDEFTTNLDICSKKEVLDYLKLYLRENKVSLLLICHEPREIYKLCKKLIVIDNGRITETVENIRESFKSERELEKFIFSVLNNPNKQEN